jgi:hypothetical protein
MKVIPMKFKNGKGSFHKILEILKIAGYRYKFQNFCLLCSKELAFSEEITIV